MIILFQLVINLMIQDRDRVGIYFLIEIQLCHE